MTYVTTSTGGPDLSGSRLLEILAAVAACHR